MVTHETVYIDNSTLSAVACSTEVTMRYIHGYTSIDERAYLRAGAAGHAAAAAWLRQDQTLEAGDLDLSEDGLTPVQGGDQKESWFSDSPLNVAMAIFRREYQAWADENVPPTDRLSFYNTSRILRYWLETHPMNAFPFRIDRKLVEIGFSHPLTEDAECGCGHPFTSHTNVTGPCVAGGFCRCRRAYSVVFCGRIDAIVYRLDDGAAYILEHKFTGSINPSWVGQFRNDSQLSGYTWSAERHLNLPVVGAFVNGVEFKKLPDSDRRCRDHATSYNECGYLHANFELLVVGRTPEQLEEWRKTALNLTRKFRELTVAYPRVEQIHKVRMQGTFFNRCRTCALNNWCAVGRPLNLINTMLVKEPWEPYKYAFGGRPETHHKP